jgi:hypothetical protein
MKRRPPIGKLSREEKELVYAWRSMDLNNRQRMINGTRALCGKVMNERNISRVYRYSFPDRVSPLGGTR